MPLVTNGNAIGLYDGFSRPYSSVDTVTGNHRPGDPILETPSLETPSLCRRAVSYSIVLPC